MYVCLFVCVSANQIFVINAKCGLTAKWKLVYMNVVCAFVWYKGPQVRTNNVN